MAALSTSHAAAVRACVALLEALEPGRTTAERREFMRAAIDGAMEATGTSNECLPSAEEFSTAEA